jgi:hypothetical protein
MKKLNIQKVHICYSVLKSLNCNPFSFLKEENEPVAEEKKEKTANNRWKKYLNLIEKALADYKECESQNCSCYKKLSLLTYTHYLVNFGFKVIFKRY